MIQICKITSGKETRNRGGHSLHLTVEELGSLDEIIKKTIKTACQCFFFHTTQWTQGSLPQNTVEAKSREGFLKRDQVHSLRPGPAGTASSESPWTSGTVSEKDLCIQALYFVLLWSPVTGYPQTQDSRLDGLWSDCMQCFLRIKALDFGMI